MLGHSSRRETKIEIANMKNGLVLYIVSWNQLANSNSACPFKCLTNMAPSGHITPSWIRWNKLTIRQGYWRQIHNTTNADHRSLTHTDEPVHVAGDIHKNIARFKAIQLKRLIINYITIRTPVMLAGRPHSQKPHSVHFKVFTVSLWM